MRTRFFALFLLCLLSACGGKTQENLPEDKEIATPLSTGKENVRLRRWEQAQIQYENAFKAALGRNDATALNVAGYNLAVVQLARGDADKAVRTCEKTRFYLGQRHRTDVHDIDLVQASALYRQGQLGAARDYAGRALASKDKVVARKAQFVIGLVADQSGDRAGLQHSYEVLSAPLKEGAELSATEKADQEELLARLLLRGGQFGPALQHLEAVIAQRRDHMDYYAMARALALAGQAWQGQGDSAQAAAFYLQAGQSAAVRGDNAKARSWLSRALALRPGDRAMEQAARESLATLKKVQEDKRP